MTDISNECLKAVREALEEGAYHLYSKEDIERVRQYCVEVLAMLPDPDAAAAQADAQNRFSVEELQRRSINAQHRRLTWKGSYPYRECVYCFEQIHVGGIRQCQECYDWEIAQEDAARSASQRAV